MTNCLEKDKLISIHYDSVIDYVEAKPHPTNADLYERFKRTAENQWYGPTAKGYDDAMKKAMLGDHELYKDLTGKIDQLRKSIRQSNINLDIMVKKPKRVRERGPQGDELDIHRVYQGRMDTAWSRTRRVDFDESTKLVTVLIDNEDNAMADSRRSIWRAAAAVVVVDELIKAGKSVRLVTYGASINSTQDNNNMTVTCTIKNYNESLSSERLVAMSHIGFGRALGFCGMAMQPHRLLIGLGQTAPYSEKFIPLQFKAEMEKGHTKVVYIGKADSLYTSEQSVQSCLEQIGKKAATDAC